MKLKYTPLSSLLFVLWMCLCIRLIQVLFVPPVAHIYIDPASTPALFQMMDMVTQSSEEPKYVAWRRYMAFFPKKLISPLNITVSSVKPSTSNNDFVQLIQKEVKLFYRQHSDHVFVIHVNVSHPWFFNPVLRIIPKDRVKHVYFYEDSIGRTIWDGIASGFLSTFLKYPVTYRLSYTEYLLERLPALKGFLQEVMISDAQKLSEKQRNRLYVLAGLNKDLVSSFFDKKPVGLFLDDCNLKTDAVAPCFQQKVVMNSEFQNINWLYKNHPRCAIEGPFWEKLKHYFPDVQLLPNKMPYEVLLMAGLVPDYVCGYSSSVFFSATPEQVLCYIERPGDKYLPLLKKMGIISDKNIIFQKDIKNNVH